MEELLNLTPEDAIRLSAKSLVAFGKLFFPRTARQESPKFHHDLSDILLTPGNRLIGVEIFRGGAKTSQCRIYSAFKPAFAIGNTGMIIGDNSTHAERSIRWLKKQIEFNKPLTQTFGLRKGSKWTDNWIEIVNERIGPQHGAPTVYTYVAMGITGGTRGLNIDDYRPDFILVDDGCNNENVATPEGREKVNDTLFGDLQKSLAPETEAPLAQMVIVQTPINAYDAISQAEHDPSFKFLKVGCFDAAGQSSWPTRWSTETLLKDKAAHIKRRQLHLWMREMEVTIIQAEKCSFDSEWPVDFTVVPDGIEYVISIDPAPVDIDKKPGEVSEDRDYLVVSVVGFFKDDVYLETQHSAKNEDPDETADAVFRFSKLYNTRNVVVEAVAYQKTLAWLIEKESKERKHYLVIELFKDRRSKYDRITQAFLTVGPYGRLHVRSGCVQFLTEFGSYGVGYKGHDDHLDSCSIAICSRTKVLQSDAVLEGEYRRLREEDEGRLLEDKQIDEEVFQSCP